jgi:hypothetical protein
MWMSEINRRKIIKRISKNALAEKWMLGQIDKIVRATIDSIPEPPKENGLMPALTRIARELDTWEQDPDKYGGDLANLAHEARALINKIEPKSAKIVVRACPFCAVKPKYDDANDVAWFAHKPDCYLLHVAFVFYKNAREWNRRTRR